MDNDPTSTGHSGWWRWPLMPFASFIGATLGAILFTLFQWFGMKLSGGYSEDGWYYLYILPVISSGIFGWLYVLITITVAPKGKIISAIIMTTIFGVLLVLASLYSWIDPHREFGYAFQSTISGITSLIAAIASIVNYKDEYNG